MDVHTLLRLPEILVQQPFSHSQGCKSINLIHETRRAKFLPVKLAGSRRQIRFWLQKGPSLRSTVHRRCRWIRPDLTGRLSPQTVCARCDSMSRLTGDKMDF